MALQALALLLALVLSVGCSATTRGPVDRSVDAAHATNRTIGESVDTAVESPSPGNVIVDAVTFPVRLVRRVFGALVDGDRGDAPGFGGDRRASSRCGTDNLVRILRGYVGRCARRPLRSPRSSARVR